MNGQTVALRRYEVIDGLRALAVTLVIVFHAFYLMLGRVDGADRDAFFARVPGWLQWVWHGEKGVDVFFVISGFLLTTLLLNERRRHGRVCLRGFYAKRLLRILPAYLVLLAFGFLAAWPNADKVWLNLLFINNLSKPGDLFLTWSWSIAVEMQFYAMLPLALWLLGYSPRRLVLAALIGLVAVSIARHALLAAEPELYRLPFYRLFDHPPLLVHWLDVFYFDTWARAGPLLIGVIAGALHLSAGQALLRAAPVLTVVGLVIVVVIFGVQHFGPESWYARRFDPRWNLLFLAHGRNIFAGGVGLMLLGTFGATGASNVVRAVLASRWWSLPAQASYSMYLFHIPILYAVAGPVLRLWSAEPLAPGGLLILAFLTWVLTLLVGSLSYLWVERPAIAWSHRLAAGWCGS